MAKKKNSDEESTESEDRAESAIKERIEENTEAISKDSPVTAGQKLIDKVKKAKGHMQVPSKRAS